MLNRGFYAIFEGNDGVGKTTVMALVSKRLREEFPSAPEALQTHHPGSTPLGKHIRQLVKYPQGIDPTINIDDMSRQCLYMIDTISFIKTLLEPSLEANKIVLADRSSFISGMIYGLADGLTISDIEKIFYALITPPVADKMYVLSCSWEVGRSRVLAGRKGDTDHYDRKGPEYYAKIAGLYDNLVTGSPEVTALVSRSVAIDDIVYVDASLSPEDVAETILGNMLPAIKERCLGGGEIAS
jgi:dTMP kinase